MLVNNQLGPFGSLKVYIHVIAVIATDDIRCFMIFFYIFIFNISLHILHDIVNSQSSFSFLSKKYPKKIAARKTNEPRHAFKSLCAGNSQALVVAFQKVG